LKTIYVVNVPTKEAINILKHMNTKNEIIKLLKKCEEHYELFKNKEIVLDQIKKKYVVKQSIPILFFGDIEEYFSSKIKIVTAALNPSDKEFIDEDSKPIDRFPEKNKKDNNYTALKNYFKKKNNPYRDWFDESFEPILEGIKSSYYSDKKGFSNRAIHTDICSPLATSPTWTDLNKDNRKDADKLKKVGQEIWKELIEIIKPDIILVSVEEKIKEEILGENKTIFWDSKSNAERNNHQDLTTNDKPRVETYKVYINDYPIKSGKKTKIIWGKANRKPFMNLDYNSDRKPRVKLGEYIFENLDSLGL
tara:strand:- start:2607 stop:3527 length:921 start_codon:yes stop_codon:yes gene_type:complete